MLTLQPKINKTLNRLFIKKFANFEKDKIMIVPQKLPEKMNIKTPRLVTIFWLSIPIMGILGAGIGWHCDAKGEAKKGGEKSDIFREGFVGAVYCSIVCASYPIVIPIHCVTTLYKKIYGK